MLPEDYPHYRDALRDYFMQRTDRFQCEYRIRVGSGEVRWLKDRASAVRRPDGRAIRLLGAVSDITAEKEVQRALAASEQRYAQALEAVNESIYDWNLVDDTVFFSPRILALFGKTHDELRTPEDWRALVHPDDMAGYHAENVAHLKGRTPRLVSEYRYRHGDGTWRWARQVGVAQRDENGRAVRLIGSTSDITAEKTLAAALKDSEARYAHALEAIGEGLYDWDIEKDEVLYSPGVRRQILMPEAELRTPQDWIDRIHPDDLPAFQERMRQHLRGATPRFECEVRYRAGDGSWRWARQHGIAVRDGTGRAIRLVGSTGDITDNKRLAGALAQAEARLKAAVEAASEGFVVWDEHDRLVMCNSVYRNFFRGRQHLGRAGRGLRDHHPRRLRGRHVPRGRFGLRDLVHDLAAASACLCRPARAVPVRRPVADRQRPAASQRRRGLGLHRHHRAQAPRARAGIGGRPLCIGARRGGAGAQPAHRGDRGDLRRLRPVRPHRPADLEQQPLSPVQCPGLALHPRRCAASG